MTRKFAALCACLFLVTCCSRGKDQSSGADTSPPAQSAGEESVDPTGEEAVNPKLELRYSERMRRSISVDDSGRLVLGGDSGPPAVVAEGEVTAVTTPPGLDHASIAGERWTALVRLHTPVTVGPRKGIRELSLQYDERALLFGAIRAGDRLRLEFTSDGELIDVMLVR